MTTRKVAGITVPDTPLITAAIELAHKHLNDISYNHVMRCWLFGFAIANKIPPLQDRDIELHSLAVILHDMGWAASGGFVSPDKRFEVDGANAAREFVKNIKGSGDGSWHTVRLQLLWDAIALHTTPSIAMHKEAEVQATGMGILIDFAGINGIPGTITQQEWDAIVAEYPRKGFRDGVVEIMCGLCKTKPETTYDNFVSDFGEELVPGFTREGHRAFEMISSTVD